MLFFARFARLYIKYICTLNIFLDQEITLSGGKCFHFSCFKCEVCAVDVSKRKYAYTGGMNFRPRKIDKFTSKLYQSNDRTSLVRAVYQKCGEDDLSQMHPHNRDGR